MSETKVASESAGGVERKEHAKKTKIKGVIGGCEVRNQTPEV